MDRYSRHNLSDSSLLDGALAHSSAERGSTADLLADIGEVEARKTYLKLAHPSLLAWCVERLGLSRSAAFDRIRVARVARHFPAIFEMIADGQHNLTSIRLLAPYLTPETADDLLRAGAHRTKEELVHLIAQRFPRPWLAGGSERELVLARVENIGEFAEGALTRSEETPLAPEIYELRLVYGSTTHDKLAYLRDLLSHQIPSGDLAAVTDRAFEIAIAQIEKQKFAATSRPRASAGNVESDSRHIPDHVQRAVWKRDGGACTYVSDDGRRCGSTFQVEFHHQIEFARGGEPTEGNVCLLCRPHNQYLAECTYRAGFMQAKRLAAGEARLAATSKPPMPEDPERRDVISGLRNLGYRVHEAEKAATAVCATMADATLEQKFRAALQYFRRGANARAVTAAAPPSPAPIPALPPSPPPASDAA